MFRPLRTIISLALLAGALWAAFAIDLGGRTFAEHADTISETPEARSLVEGTRARINPALQEVRDRVLGEYVEAPTWIADEGASLAPVAPFTSSPSTKSEPEPPTLASTLTPEAEPPLPGRRARTPLEPLEPRLPGHR